MDMDMEIEMDIEIDYSWQKSVVDYIRIQAEGYCAVLRGPKGCGKSHLAHMDPDIIFIEQSNLYGADKEIILTLMYISKKSNSKIILICDENTDFNNELNQVYFNNNVVLEEM